MIRLNVNEMPWNLTESPGTFSFKLSLDVNQLSFNRYPDSNYLELRGKIANQLSVKTSQITLANGSDELIWLTLSVLLKAGDTIATHAPTFGEYERMANLMGLRTLYTPIAPDLKIDLDNLLTVSRRYGARMVFLCRPNNPTGELIPYETLIAFLKSYEGYVILDEAYIEFSNEPSLLPLIEEFPNLVVFRTFSKAYGMAGLRLGYGIASEAITEALNANRPPYNINVVTESVAKAAMDQTDFFQSRIDALMMERTKISANLKASNIPFIPSSANFILLTNIRSRFGRNGVELGDALALKGFCVRAFKDPGLSDCIRFSLGTSEENQSFIQAVHSLCL